MWKKKVLYPIERTFYILSASYAAPGTTHHTFITDNYSNLDSVPSFELVTWNDISDRALIYTFLNTLSVSTISLKFIRGKYPNLSYHIFN